MKLGVIIPTRGDRPELFANAIRLIDNQTLQPTNVCVVNHEPQNENCDITQRYRLGYDSLRGLGLDVIALMEDDDWYSENYLATMVHKWEVFGKPDLFGTINTIYYNILLNKYYTMHHTERSSAMSTLIKPDMNFDWCADTEPYTDSHLWFNGKHKDSGKPFTKKTFAPIERICLGIKHGIGKTGGQCHTTQLHRYDSTTGVNDSDQSFLKETVDETSFKLYELLKNKYAQKSKA